MNSKFSLMFSFTPLNDLPKKIQSVDGLNLTQL